MNITRKRRLFAGAIAASLVFAACGDDDSEEGSESTETSDGESTDTEADVEETTEETDAPSEETEPTDSEPMSTDEGTDGGGEVELASGDVNISGSSTVEPISVRVGELANELSGGELNATVDGPGTGDGFALFCTGETDISDASRPIQDEEIAQCEENGINYVELEVAIDGLTVMTSPNNEEVECLDIPALYALVGPESEGTSNWSDNNELAEEVGSASGPFPDAPLEISGPGEESGTYDTFVEFSIEGLAEERGQDANTRADYNSSGNDNLIMDGVTGSDTSLGWVGYSYYFAQQDTVKALEIDGGDGCVAPSEETISDGSYPFSRSLYIYVNADAAEENPAVESYVDLYLSEDGLATVSEAGYVDLPAERIQATQDAWANR